MTINRINDQLNTIRNMPVEELMETSIIISKDEPLSKIISNLIETGSYDVFIELSGKVAALNIRIL